MHRFKPSVIPYKFLSALMIVVLALSILSTNQVHAVSAQLNAWTLAASTGASANAATINAGNVTVSAGTNRLFLAAVCMELGGPNTVPVIAMSLGGTTLTPIGSTGATTMTEQCYMGYLLDSQISTGPNALTVSYDINGVVTVVTGAHIYWASYSGIDQSTPINDSNASTNGANNVTFGQQIDYLSDGVTFYVAANIGSPATMTAPAGFSQRLATTSNGHSSFIGQITAVPHAASNNYGTTTIVSFGGTTGARSSLIVASLRPAATTIGDGTSPADKYVKASNTNQAASAFTLSTSSATDTVTQVTITGTNTGNIAANGAKLWLDNGSIPNEWDAADTQIGAGVSFAGATATFTGLGISVNTTPVQYLITYDISATPTNGAILTDYVSGVNATNSITNNDNADAILTIDSIAPDTTITANPMNPSNDSNPVFSFIGDDGTGSGVASFECQMDGDGFIPCITPLNYTGLSAGSHTFEVRAADVANNLDPTPASYIWMIDLGFPIITASTPKNNATLYPGPTQLIVEFSEDVKNDSSVGAANTLANYLLVEGGLNNVFNTVSCADGLAVDDTLVTIDGAVYTNNSGSGPFVAILDVNGGSPLPDGTYRLFVCGTTSIDDLAGNELNGGEGDTQINFVVRQDQIAAARLPATGFPMGEVTSLEIQPAELAYSSYAVLWLEIPKLNLKTTIIGVPKTKDGWNVDWLNKDAGWLNGSAFPTWNGNSVITAHVWDALNRPGPFANLKNLRYGDQIKVHAFGQVYTYAIRESKAVLPTNILAVFKHEEKSWITLMTCEDYKERSQTYSYRRMVRAVLVSVTSE